MAACSRARNWPPAEIGHTTIDFQGAPGLRTHNPGDLEGFVGNHRIAERAAAFYKAAGREVAIEQCTPRDLEQAAHVGDPIARGMWEQICD